MRSTSTSRLYAKAYLHTTPVVRAGFPRKWPYQPVAHS
ncbi:hypothetical protein RCH06_001315 [Polaromonas sp. CG_9.5]|nr:hypothetical protein [Polaromonas sp. CG_9.5]